MKKRFALLFLLAFAIYVLAIINLNIALDIQDDPNIPLISLVLPTPLNNSYNSPRITINYTATGTNLQSAFLDLNRSLVLWYRMNNASDENATLVKDWSSYGNNGTAVNGANLTSGIMGTAFSFNGDDEYINGTDRPEFSPAYYNLTILAWIKPATFNFVANDISSLDAIHFLSKANSNSEYEWMFRMYNRSNPSNRPKRISIYACNITGGLCTGSYFEDNLTENEWIHVAGIITKTYTSIYKNGILRDTDTHSQNLQKGNAPIRVGRANENNSPTSSFNGSIDDVMIFDRELSEAEILALYNATGPFAIPFNFSLGNYTAKAYAQNLNGSVNLTQERTFAVGNETSQLSSLLISPANNTVIGIKNSSFICNATAEILSNISLYTNTNGSWSVNATRTIAGTSNQTSFNVTGIADGAYLWNCLVQDANNTAIFNSTNRTITIDTAAPYAITLSSPINSSTSGSSSVAFNISATDNLDTNITCNITLDYLINKSLGVIAGGSTVTINGISNGTHYWNATCHDNANNSNFSATSQFIVDTARPSSVTLISPEDGYSSTTQTVSFNVSAIDNLDSNITCNITIDSLIALSTTLTNGTSKSNNIAVNPGSHTWNVTCYDNALNSNYSITRSFTISQAASSATTSSSGGGGGSTSATKKKSRIYNNLAEGDAININLDDTSFTNAKIIIAANTPEATIGFEPVTEIPPRYDEFGKIYKSIEANTNLKAADISSAKFNFKVDIKWLDANGAKPEDIALYRFSSAWSELPTSLTKVDDAFAYYEATTPGFSYFTIASRKLNIVDLSEGVELDSIDMASSQIVEDVAVPKTGADDIVGNPMKTALLFTAVLTTIVYALLLERLLKKRIIG